MSNAPNHPVSDYLARLAAQAYGQDPALVHDMLADAEQHLLNAVRDGVLPEAAVADFGEPEDVVRAYVIADRREAARRGNGRASWSTPKPLPVPERSAPRIEVIEPKETPPSRLTRVPLLGIWFDRRAWGSLVLFIVGLAPAIVYFTLMVAGVCLALGTLPIFVGIPLLVLMLGMSRFLAIFHGQIIEALTGVRMPRRFAARPATGTLSFWGRIRLWITDGRSWLSAAFLVGNFPVAIFLFVMFVTLTSLSVSFLAAPIAGAMLNSPEWLDQPNIHFHILGRRFTHSNASENVLLCLGAGLAISTLTLYLARGAGWLYAQAAKAIQVTRPTSASAMPTW